MKLTKTKLQGVEPMGRHTCRFLKTAIEFMIIDDCCLSITMGFCARKIKQI